MNTRIAATLIAASFSVAAVAADQGTNDAYWTNVDASFANMLSHEPYYGPTAVTVARGEKDPVELALHWREQRVTQVADPGYWDNVNASFALMLDRTPYAGPTAVTVARGGKDPIEASLHADAEEAAPAPAPLAIDTDPVRASFQRMLDHAPYAGATAVTVELGTRDPVERIVFEMLKDVRQPVRLAQQ
jgi:hypothetical protein